MGCDIHGVIDRSVDATWIAVSVLDAVFIQGLEYLAGQWPLIATADDSPRVQTCAGKDQRRGGPPQGASDTARYLFKTTGDRSHAKGGYRSLRPLKSS